MQHTSPARSLIIQWYRNKDRLHLSLFVAFSVSIVLPKRYTALLYFITIHKRGSLTLQLWPSIPKGKSSSKHGENCSGMGQCPMFIKHPLAEYNEVIDHLMSSLKPCVSSHSFNKGKMSTVYRPEKMDHSIFCHWLWDMFMKTMNKDSKPCTLSTSNVFLAISICYWAILYHLSDHSAIFTDITYLQCNDSEL